MDFHADQTCHARCTIIFSEYQSSLVFRTQKDNNVALLPFPTSGYYFVYAINSDFICNSSRQHASFSEDIVGSTRVAIVLGVEINDTFTTDVTDTTINAIIQELSHFRGVLEVH
jgi:hypothetical protein